MSFLITHGDCLSAKGKKLNKELQEKYNAEIFDFILDRNINSKLDLSPDSYILIK